jgi:DNA mismatch repair protein MutS
MQIDKTTLYDLAILSREEEHSIFHQLNFTQTNEGRDILRQILTTPLESIEAIEDTQHTIQYLISIHHQIPTTITNGTLMVIEKFYLTALEAYPNPAKKINSFIYKYISKPDFFLTKYSVEHFIDFINGLNEIKNLLQKASSKKAKNWANRIRPIFDKEILQQILNENKNDITDQSVLKYANYFKNDFKYHCQDLIEVYSNFDAYLSLAKATEKFGFQFPQFIESDEPTIKASALYHPLLANPVGYEFDLNLKNNFLFLTGANMAGKSTFIKATGIAVYLAHIGMSVSANELQLSYFDGLLSNIQIVDNVLKNESFFYNEVQRIKNTVLKVNNQKKWLILIDELFKGTNIHDAMKCSVTVIEGLQKRRNGLYILSTHLYEIGEQVAHYKNIQFKYFETAIVNNEMEFSFQLKDGISDDRLGYMILEKEGVVELLKN